MKKVKYHKKYKTKSYRRPKKKIKYHIVIFILFYIFLIPLIIITIIKRKKALKKREKIKKYFSLNFTDEIYFKGGQISKSKLIDNYLTNISDKNKYAKIFEKNRFNIYFNLPEYPEEPEIQELVRKKIYNDISNITKRTITKIDTILLERSNPFGNNIICINNAIFYCEVLGCNKIILYEHAQKKWFIKKPIFIQELNLTIITGPNVNCKADNILCIYRTWDILYPFLLKPQIRTQYIKEEILSNLPNINLDPEDLYIHMRGGDVFRIVPVPTYAQPPMCFYERIINKNKFKNIYIIADDKRNYVFHPLIKKYPNIIYQKNSLEKDLSILTHAFNIALSISSFCLSAIKFNDNLNNVYEYDLYRLSEMFIHLHHYVFKLNQKYIIHSMKPSQRYVSKMFNWIYSHKQRHMMIEENCTYDFTIIKPNS